MKIEHLKSGQTVYHVGRYKMGNTTMRTVGVWDVVIVSVDETKGAVMARWNGNQAQKYYRNSWSKWRKERPYLVKDGLGHRLATREEIKAILTPL